MPTTSKYYAKNRLRILERQRAKRAQERANRVVAVPKANSVTEFTITHGVYVVRFD